MVYRSGKLNTAWLRSTVRRSFYTIAVMLTVIFFFIKEMTADRGAAHFSPHSDIPVILCFIVTAWIWSKYIGKKTEVNIKLYDNSFYTLTESGILCENNGCSHFFTWDALTWVRRFGCNITLQPAHGSNITLILKDEPESRRREMLRYIQTHIGKTDDTQLIPPPLDMAQESGLPYSATPQQLRETADTTALLKTTRMRWYLRYGLLIIWSLWLVAGAYSGKYTMMAIALVFLLLNLYKQRRPGGSNKRLSKFQAYTLHTDGKSVLIKQKKCWILLKQAQAKACYKTPNNHLLDFGNGQYLGVDAHAKLPPALQVPEETIPAKTPLAALSVIALTILGGTLYAFTFSNPWHMYHVLNGKDTDNCHVYALTELDEYDYRWVRKIRIHRFEKDFHPLWKTRCEFCPVLIRIYWVDDRLVYTDYFFDSDSNIQQYRRYDAEYDDIPNKNTDSEHE